MPATRVILPPEAFIRTLLVLQPLPFRPDISLYRPGPGSGLHPWLEAQGRGDIPPYWAYAWAGGAALTLYLRDHPEAVAGKTVLDFGAGSGLVAIAAARAGAADVLVLEPDPIGRIAARLNAEANDVTVRAWTEDARPDIILAGDIFYDEAVAARSILQLTAFSDQGAQVVIGDPFRRALPLKRLDPLAEYAVPDMGSNAPVRGGIFALRQSGSDLD